MARVRLGAAAVIAGVAVLAVASCDSGDPAAPNGNADAASPDAGSADAVVQDSGPVRAPFGLDGRPSNPTCTALSRPPSALAVAFETYASMPSLFGAMMIAQPPGDATRWLIAFRDGKLGRLAAMDPTTPPTTVADIGALAGIAVNTDGEGGFLGFAFHPSFSQNGRVYVSWTSADGPPPAQMRSRIGFLTSTDGGASFTSYTNLLAFDQPDASHNGGGIAFGPDGRLYASFGDGTLAENGQRTTGFFSKVLRIDVDGPKAAGLEYGIPADNPFATANGEPATFARGFRNPFRFSFDRATGELWLGDVGESKWEEIDVVKRGGNYGWPCREGAHDYTGLDPVYCPSGVGDLVEPLFDYEHAAPNTYRSITGGVVYRGKAIPSLVGAYVFADYQTQEVFALTLDPTTAAPKTQRLNENGPSALWVDIAEDANGELYLVSLYGAIHRIVPASATPAPTSFPARLSQTGCTDPTDAKKPAPGLIPYGVNAEFWSDGASKRRWFALPDGKTINRTADGDFDLPPGSVAMKTFSVGATRVETRLLVRHDDGEWAGYSYEWLDDQTDAILLPSNNRKTVGGVDWYFPSRGECMRCHTAAAGRTLGLELGQLNGDFVYPTTNRISNQLATLEHVGVFSVPLGASPDQLPVIPSPFGVASLEKRARAYLHANCAGCHRPGNVSRATIDLRFGTPLLDTKTCGVEGATGNAGVPSAKLLLPGDPGRSLVSIRPHALDAARMPPLGSSVVDVAGLAVVDGWIQGLAACP